MNSAINSYEQTYKKSPGGVSFCPYRICPLGAHVDHNLGKVTGMAINAGVRIAYGAKQNGVVELSSIQFDKRAQWHVSSTPEAKEGDWADYLRGATLALSARYPLRIGLSGVIEGSLPIGGLSSSAAVIIAFLGALCKVNRITLTEREIIEIAIEAENKFVGVACGKLDQSCEVFSRRNHLLFLDTKDDSYELIPTSPLMKPYKIAIFFSGSDHLFYTGINTTLTDSPNPATHTKWYNDVNHSCGYTVLNINSMLYSSYIDATYNDWLKTLSKSDAELMRDIISSLDYAYHRLDKDYTNELVLVLKNRDVNALKQLTNLFIPYTMQQAKSQF